MDRGFWEKLPKPFFALAPMADVTDAAFRRMFAKYGKPDVFWTEFVSADGLFYTREKAKLPDTENPLMRDLMFSADEHPIVAQLFTANPETMEYAAALARELGFDGIDINMGCPDRSIEKQGAGAALIKNPAQAVFVVNAAKRGAKDLPVSVKTRIGYARREEIEDWLPKILATDVAALTLHARTRKEMSLVPARWEHVGRAVVMRNAMGLSTKILGNGDVKTIEEGKRRAEETGADGAMIGRGIFGNPWRFRGDLNPDEIPLKAKLAALVEHTNLFAELLPHKNFAIMKKHYKAYVNGFDGASELRGKLMEAKSAEEVQTRVNDFIEIAYGSAKG